MLQGDDYNHIMVEAIADRLAEAFAEKLHEIVRREVWGYAPDENLTPDDMLKVKYQGEGHHTSFAVSILLTALMYIKCCKHEDVP